MSSMKISIILRDITERGGGERVCANLANALVQKHQVQIISFYHLQSLSYPLDERIELLFLSNVGEKSGGSWRAFLRRIFYRYILSWQVQKYLKDAQIVIANDRALAPFLKQRDKSYIRLWHLNFSKRKRNLRFFDALVVLSNKELEKWRAIHPNVWVIPNFLPCIGKSLTKWDQYNVLSVGRMDRGDQKGFLRLVEIFASIAPKYPQWTLTLVGEGILKEQIEQKIKILNLEHQIILKPFTQEIEQEYLKASFYVMASYFEGFGMVLAESGSYGLASVAFDICSGPSDLIEDGETGYLVEDGDLEGFACKMELLMQSQALREEMGCKARRKIEEEFLQESVLLKWEKLFSLLQTHNPQSLR